MPLRPFPFALRVGTDICNVSRVRRLVAGKFEGRSYLNRFVRRILTDPEATYFWNRFGPQSELHTKLDAVAQYLAGRFAAKEAIRKACGHFGHSTRAFHRIMILPVASDRQTTHKSAPPQGLILDEELDAHYTIVRDFKGPARVLVKKHASGVCFDVDSLDGQLCELSISHDGDFATAVALVPLRLESLSDTESSGADEVESPTQRSATDMSDDLR